MRHPTIKETKVEDEGDAQRKKCMHQKEEKEKESTNVDFRLAQAVYWS